MSLPSQLGSVRSPTLHRREPRTFSNVCATRIAPGPGREMFPSPGAERLLVGLRGDREPVEKAAPGQLGESVTQITTDCDKRIMQYNAFPRGHRHMIASRV